MCERITHFCIVAVLFNYFSKIERACVGVVCAHAVEIDGEFAVHQVHSALHVGHGKLFVTRNFGSSSLIIRNYLRTFECVACGGVGDGQPSPSLKYTAISLGGKGILSENFTFIMEKRSFFCAPSVDCWNA